MNLSFVLKSLRRYWWLFAAFTVAGALPGALLLPTDTISYESRAVLLISPPSESRTQVSFTNDPDRYVLGQLSVLRSTSIADLVAIRVGEDLTAADVAGSIEVEHEPETDIVVLIVTTGDPELSRDIANGYVDVYFETLQEQVAETRQDEIDRLDEQLASIRDRIDEIDTDITRQMQRYLPEQSFLEDGAFAPIPSPDQVAPALVSERTLLQQEYQAVFGSRTSLAELDINARLRVTSEVVQRGTLPTAPITEGHTLVTAAGMLAGAFFGLVACVALARVSRTAVDEEQISEVLGVSIFGEMPSSRQFARNRRAVVETVPPRLLAFLDRLAVAAESAAEVGESLTVAVVGSERSAGTTTLASTLANRYAVNGSQVLLVDVDPRDSELTRLFGGNAGGIPALLAAAERAASGTSGRRGRTVDPFSPTSVPGLSVVGIGDKGSVSGGVRRQQLPQLMEVATQHAHVVVFDGGPLLDAATTVQLAQMVDAVVLAVPMRKVYTRHIGRVAAQLQGRRGELLPVLVPASRRSGGRSDGTQAVAPIADDDVSEVAEPVSSSR